MYPQGEEHDCAGASADGGGGEGLSLAEPGDREFMPESPAECFCLSAPTGDSVPVPGGCGGAAGQDEGLPGALEGSLDGEAERVRSEAGVALWWELGSLNSYPE